MTYLQDQDEVLYHYTSIEAFNNIFRSRKVWASDCRFLNDKKELNDAINKFVSGLSGLQKDVANLAFSWYSNSRERWPRLVGQNVCFFKWNTLRFCLSCLGCCGQVFKVKLIWRQPVKRTVRAVAVVF
jgi:hypothetical protein